VVAMNSTCKDTWAGDQQMVKQRSLQHDNTVASSSQEHAGGCCRGGQHKMCNVGQERVGWESKAWRGHTIHTAACIINTDTSRHRVH
jgi:hypothetical protein